MGARTKARKRALDILFESELRGLAPGATLEERRADAAPPVPDYTVTLVEGVAEFADEIDATIAACSEGWLLERMPAVDRNLLRIGVFELRHVDSVPSGAVLSEAVRLAGQLSTDDSAAFVNGVLARIAGEVARAMPASAEPATHSDEGQGGTDGSWAPDSDASLSAHIEGGQAPATDARLAPDSDVRLAEDSDVRLAQDT